MSGPGNDFQNPTFIYKPTSSRASQKSAKVDANRISQVSLQAFEEVWSPVNRRLETVLFNSNASTVRAVKDFLSQVDVTNREQIPAGFITSSSASGSLFEQLRKSMPEETILLNIASSQCTNLKSMLKHITTQVEVEVHAGQRLLNYDLERLQIYTKQENISKVVLYFANGESLDGNALSELIEVLSCYMGRIPFVLLFEIAVSVELFQEKLSRKTIGRLQSTTFETKDPIETLDLLFKAATVPSTQSLWLGPGVVGLLWDRQTEHVPSAGGFIQMLKYSYMSQFMATPINALLSDGGPKHLEKDDYEAIRDMKSFIDYSQDLLSDKKAAQARKLLQDDRFLHKTVVDLLHQSQENLQELSAALEVMMIIGLLAPSKIGLSWAKLYMQGTSGKLKGSPLMSELLLSVRTMPSDVMIEFLKQAATHESFAADLKKIHADLDKLISAHDATGKPLRSEHDIRHDTLRTTVVAQKVELSKQKAALSRQDTEYSKIVNRVDLALKAFLNSCLIDPKELYFHEIFLFDSKAPIREAFGPSARLAIERALTNPCAYLACDCCIETGGSLMPSQPATAILYQLYLESGALINISDLWSAFMAIAGADEQEQNDDESQNELLANFYRGLAELRYLGMIKSSRKRADHLTKLRWQGL